VCGHGAGGTGPSAAGKRSEVRGSSESGVGRRQARPFAIGLAGIAERFDLTSRSSPLSMSGVGGGVSSCARLRPRIAGGPTRAVRPARAAGGRHCAGRRLHRCRGRIALTPARIGIILTGRRWGRPEGQALGLRQRGGKQANLAATVDRWDSDILAVPPLFFCSRSRRRKRSSHRGLAEAFAADAHAQLGTMGDLRSGWSRKHFRGRPAQRFSDEALCRIGPSTRAVAGSCGPIR